MISQLFYFFRDDDVLYVSAGERFIPIAGTTKAGAVVPVGSSSTASSSKDWVTLNVGGKYFTTSRSTLIAKEPLSMLARYILQI